MGEIEAVKRVRVVYPSLMKLPIGKWIRYGIFENYEVEFSIVKHFNSINIKDFNYDIEFNDERFTLINDRKYSYSEKDNMILNSKKCDGIKAYFELSNLLESNKNTGLERIIYNSTNSEIFILLYYRAKLEGKNVYLRKLEEDFIKGLLHKIIEDYRTISFDITAKTPVENSIPLYFEIIDFVNFECLSKVDIRKKVLSKKLQKHNICTQFSFDEFVHLVSMNRGSEPEDNYSALQSAIDTGTMYRAKKNDLLIKAVQELYVNRNFKNCIIDLLTFVDFLLVDTLVYNIERQKISNTNTKEYLNGAFTVHKLLNEELQKFFAFDDNEKLLIGQINSLKKLRNSIVHYNANKSFPVITRAEAKFYLEKVNEFYKMMHLKCGMEYIKYDRDFS